MPSHDYSRALELAISRCPEAAEELAALAAWLPHALAQRDAGEKILRSDAPKSGSAPRITVKFVRYGTRLLDVDNFAGGCKGLLDACRYENLIPGDDPTLINLEFSQVKVRKADVGTEILITYEPDTLPSS